MKIVYLAAVALGALYVLNPGFGVFEIIPDNMAVVGNLDEAGAIGLIIWGVKRLRAAKTESVEPRQ
jgi:hypothetical protein